MGYVRFFRRVQLAPGVRLNLSKSGPSLSLGVRGAHVTMGRRGVTRTVGVPGTGLFYTSRTGHHSGAHSATHFSSAGDAAPTPAAGCIGVLAVLVALGLLARWL